MVLDGPRLPAEASPSRRREEVRRAIARQPLPLHRLPADHRRHHGRRARATENRSRLA